MQALPAAGEGSRSPACEGDGLPKHQLPKTIGSGNCWIQSGRSDMVLVVSKVASVLATEARAVGQAERVGRVTTRQEPDRALPTPCCSSRG